MKLSDFDFELPPERIAQEPAPRRDGSRLMVVNRKTGAFTHTGFADLPAHLPPNPLLVFNDTRVLPARLRGQRMDSGARTEMLLIRETGPKRWEALVKGLGKMRPGTGLVFGDGALKAILRDRAADRGVFELEYQGDLGDVLRAVGYAPLPPYIKRPEGNSGELRQRDQERYQTVFAAQEGAIAAPTAGLHFTPAMMETLKNEVAETVFLTLHVGVGTFQPIRSEDVVSHTMVPEYFRISGDAFRRLQRARKEAQPIVAVGSTSTRVLESVDLNSVGSALNEEVSGWTGKFIYPGMDFDNVDVLLTNFHLPKSTLYLLVCAFAGKELMQRAYREAIQMEYRFFSYGDAMLIL